MPVKKTPIVNRKSSIVKPNKAERKTTNEKRQPPLSIPVYSLAGRATGTLALPKEIFGKEVNEQSSSSIKKLLAQAVRVYSTNQKSLLGKTKTRGEVEGSTVKIFRQKGTGRARHGSVRAPIFVGGGIVFGPQPRKVRLGMPQKMKKAALYNAMSVKLSDKEIVGVSGIDKATGKTKEIVELLKKINAENALILVVEKQDAVIRAVRNIPQVHTLPVNQVNAYEVLKHNMLIVSKEAIEQMVATPVKETK